MVFRSKILAVLMVVILFGGIAVSALTGYWRTEALKVPSKFTSGELAGEYNPADIRGSYTFEDIERTFGVPVEVLARAYGLSGEENPEALQPKLFEEVYEASGELDIGTDSLRLFVALYTQRPYTPEEGTGLPYPALSILKQEGKIDQDTFERLKESIGVDMALLLGQTSAGSETSLSEARATEDGERLIKGKTTFGEVMDWGVSETEIQGVLGGEMGPPGMSIRDYCTEKGIEFSPIKTGLQELVDRAAE
jgi:hypothetical protein